MPQSDDRVDDVPVFLADPEGTGDPFHLLVGRAGVNEYGTLVITVPPNGLTEHIPHLAKLDQIVGLSIGVQYKLPTPSEENH
jgi:hypothetical protein